MANALIGYSGFVGGTLQNQTHFDFLYRSTNIAEIQGKEFDTVVCAGAPAQKWIANSRPEADLENILGLIDILKSLKCKKFILISTVDVFMHAVAVDENTQINEIDLHPYGLHRRLLEKFVEEQFSNHLIVRLPGLVGPGLRKNVIYDFLNNNNVESIDSNAVFQFYPMVNLWYDISIAVNANLKLVHLTAAPISVGDISKSGFGVEFQNTNDKPSPVYDMRTIHASLFGVKSNYQYSYRETIQAVRAYAQSEPKTKGSAL
ncbi:MULTISPECIES: NAD-dependent epimerase/dehydratase family protein [unclassified Pseudomonas]|uniref:NAD-dependent epimerase/dehydratase family protein n=1 Tax=unclassified Pseudomonas TaxID=196821 RepID=UPI000A1DB178|nr:MULTISPECIES: NAD-dependent epimerase/dehydratase family protein [unclassified Pseudomonas]MCX4219533.1 NAD(P)-dependent oxidoreductase [Pseudomonas sp. MCal1]UDI91415.1 NAD(P)-dependent oxidoreductase [Pseudomonas sp. IAC-BECa141]